MIKYRRIKAVEEMTSTKQKKKENITRGLSDLEVKASELVEALKNASDLHVTDLSSASDWLMRWRELF